MAAGVTDRVWEIEDIVRLLEEQRQERLELRSSKFGSVLGF